MKNVLIVGKNSYIGESFLHYMEQYPDEYAVSELNTIGLKPTPELFKGVDVIFCVAGIAHIRETKDNQALYFEINRDLVLDIASKAKEAGVRQFINLSTMSVYGKTTGTITKNTAPAPKNAYGKSKAQADEGIMSISDENFIYTCLRPPMVYGKNCKGNYQALRTFALKSPIFPDFKNRRSMVYIGNLCEFVKRCIDEELKGVFFPQNSEYTNTSRMVELIAQQHGKNIKLVRVFNGLIRLFRFNVIKKVFGDLTYEKTDLVDKYGFEESIVLTER